MIQRILELREQGLTLRQISEELKKENIKVSFSKVGTIIREYESGESSSEEQETESFYYAKVDTERLTSLKAALSDTGNWDIKLKQELLNNLKASILCLIEQNVNEHIRGEARLNKEYLTFYKDLFR